MRWLLFFLVGLVSFSANCADLPAQIKISFTLNRDQVPIGNITETISHNGKTYSISSEAHAIGLLSLVERGGILRQSRGAIEPRSLRPQQYRETRAGKTATARFDWSKKLLYLDYKD